MSELPTLYRLGGVPQGWPIHPDDLIQDGWLVPVTETLYVIDVKAFDPYWNESHHEALGAMIEAGLIRPVKEGRR